MNMRRLLVVLVVLIAALPVLAQTDVGFKGIGGRLAFVDPEGDYDGTIGFGVVADLGEWIPQLHWDASAMYWSSSAGYVNGDFKIHDVGLRSSVKYHFIKGPWEPYAGGGIGIHMYGWSYEWHHGYYGAPDNTNTQFGLQILGGVEHQFNPNWKGSAEVEFDFQDFGQTLLQVNAIYMLGK
jgi:hypothetical protein